MTEQRARSADDLIALRDVALVDALSSLDPAQLNGELDLNAVVTAIDPAALGPADFRRLLVALEGIASQRPDLDITSVRAAEFLRLVAATSREQLETALGVPRLRSMLLDEIFRRMSSHVRADRVARGEVVVRWRLTGGDGSNGFDRYEVVLANGTCEVNREMTKTPRATITVSPADFVRLITQQATPPVLFVTGKIRVKGDLGFAAGLIGYFDLPKP